MLESSRLKQYYLSTRLFVIASHQTSLVFCCKKTNDRISIKKLLTENHRNQPQHKHYSAKVHSQLITKIITLRYGHWVSQMTWHTGTTSYCILLESPLRVWQECHSPLRALLHTPFLFPHTSHSNPDQWAAILFVITVQAELSHLTSNNHEHCGSSPWNISSSQRKTEMLVHNVELPISYYKVC